MTDPAGILGRIVADKRAQVAARQAQRSFEQLRAQASPTGRSLRAALARPGPRFIMEIKRASPSGGAIRADADATALARSYDGAADAVSVLTDEAYFGGSLHDLRDARRGTQAPLLCKDFVLSPYQVTEARVHGADAVLLMMSVLDDATVLACLEEARRLGMDALVEVHDEGELTRALRLPAPIIGVNNRDLRTLKVDLGVTERLARRIPRDRLVVAESGIESRADVQRLAPFADGFLVGSSLMRAGDVRQAARALVFGRTKICGVTNPTCLTAVREAGAAFAGLVFVSESPRNVAMDAAEAGADVASGLPLVGVFRDAPTDRVASIARHLGLAAVQLHGREDSDYIAELRPRLPEGCAIWSVAPVGSAPIARAPAGADRTVFDTAVDGLSGGTGQAFDWRRVADRPELGAGLIAGGLSAANVRAAQNLGPWALDIGSGVEGGSGVKSPARLAALFDALRGADRLREAA